MNALTTCTKMYVCCPFSDTRIDLLVLKRCFSASSAIGIGVENWDIPLKGLYD